MPIKIFVFCNSCRSSEDHVASAIAEDGEFLNATHLCSSHGYIAHDMGVTSDWKHKTYRAAYPDGFEVVYVERGDPRLDEAYKKHLSKYLETNPETSA